MSIFSTYKTRTVNLSNVTEFKREGNVISFVFLDGSKIDWVFGSESSAVSKLKKIYRDIRK